MDFRSSYPLRDTGFIFHEREFLVYGARPSKLIKYTYPDLLPSSDQIDLPELACVYFDDDVFLGGTNNCDFFLLNLHEKRDHIKISAPIEFMGGTIVPNAAQWNRNDRDTVAITFTTSTKNKLTQTLTSFQSWRRRYRSSNDVYMHESSSKYSREYIKTKRRREVDAKEKKDSTMCYELKNPKSTMRPTLLRLLYSKIHFLVV